MKKQATPTIAAIAHTDTATGHDFGSWTIAPAQNKALAATVQPAVVTCFVLSTSVRVFDSFTEFGGVKSFILLEPSCLKC